MAEEEQNNVEMLDEEGNVTKCEIYDVIDMDDKTYALLLPLSESEEDDDAEVIVMEYIEEGEDGYFQNIDDDEEFQRVCEYIQSLEDDEEENEE